MPSELRLDYPPPATTMTERLGSKVAYVAHGSGGSLPWAVKYHTPAFRRTATPEAFHTLYFHAGGTVSFRKCVEGRVYEKRMATGASCFVPSDECAQWSANGPFSHICVYIDPAALRKFSEENTSGAQPTIDPFLGVQDPWIRFYFDLLQAEVRLYGNGALELDSMLLEQSQQMVMRHLVAWYSDCSWGLKQNGQANCHAYAIAPVVHARVLDYIQDNLHSAIQLHELAEIAKLSENHFIRCFRQMTGKTPYRYVRDQRLEVATRFLRESRSSIQEIAVKCGFRNASHFSAVFRVHLGTTPSLYRRGFMS